MSKVEPKQYEDILDVSTLGRFREQLVATPVRFTMRLGKPNAKDRHDFITLWREFLVEHSALGSDVAVTEENLLEFLKVYDSYTQGSLFGLAVLAYDAEGCAQGTSLVGEQPGGFNIVSAKPGRVAFVWGVYVRPSARRARLSLQIQHLGVPELLRMGFTRVRSMVLTGYAVGESNAQMWGALPLATIVERDITNPYEPKVKA